MSHRYALEISGDFQTTNVDMRGPIPNAKTDPRYVDVKLRLTNRSQSPMSFTFNTTQRFDIDLVNAAGAVVTRWSQGQAFGDIVTTQQLPPEGSWDFEGQLPLFDPSFNWAPAGQYTISVFLTANVRPGAQSPLLFQIGLLP
ncbi:MAG: BsuPI-related putative proteinase inhibitor [Bryobacteraceae bacterium]|jgi:hypothetical protein